MHEQKSQELSDEISDDGMGTANNKIGGERTAEPLNQPHSYTRGRA